MYIFVIIFHVFVLSFYTPSLCFCVFFYLSPALIYLSLCVCVSPITPICRCSPAGPLMEPHRAHGVPDWLNP